MAESDVAPYAIHLCPDRLQTSKRTGTVNMRQPPKVFHMFECITALAIAIVPSTAAAQEKEKDKNFSGPQVGGNLLTSAFLSIGSQLCTDLVD